MKRKLWLPQSFWFAAAAIVAAAIVIIWKSDGYALFIAYFSGIMLLCLAAAQAIGQDGRPLLEQYADFLLKGYSKDLSPLQVNDIRTIIVMNFAITGLLLFFCAYLLWGQYHWAAAGSFTITLIYNIIFMARIRRGALPQWGLRLFFISAMISSVMLHILLSGTEDMPGALLWILAGLSLPLLVLRGRNISHYFSLFSALLALDIAAQVLWRPSLDISNTLLFCASLFFIGFLIFTSTSQYVSSSELHYEQLDNTIKQLRDTQSFLVQQEKMASLGQLIAGVAHEINTPLGAVKASAENLEVNAESIFGNLMEAGRRFSPRQQKEFFRLIELAKDSFQDMRTTIEVRRAKAALRKYVAELGWDHGEAMLSYLEKLELCDMEKFEENIDIFADPQVVGLLEVAYSAAPFINSSQTIILASERVAKIVFALKSFAHKSSSVGHEPLDVIKSIENVLILYHNQIKNGIAVHRNYDESAKMVLANADELTQVWTNIIQNAIQAMSGLGRLSISLQRGPNQLALISFSDSGPGIAPEQLDHIFQPFYTTKPMGEGSGLGLDICRKIVEAHNGTITVSSELGAGATFTISLPLALK